MSAVLLRVVSLCGCALVSLGALDGAVDCSKSVKTAWEQYVCSVTARTVKGVDPACFPASYTSDVAVKGAVLLYHGYTACPDSLSVLATKLASSGYHVLVPLNPGHGRIVGQCGAGTDCVNGSPVDELPTKSDEYESFVRSTTAAFRSEVARRGLSPATHTIGVSGMSLGGALVASALEQDRGQLFNTGLMVNPFFGMTVPPLDAQVQQCLGPISNAASFDACLNTVVADMVANFAAQAGVGANSAVLATPQVAAMKSALTRALAAAVRLIAPDPTVVRGGYESLQSLARFAAVELVRRPELVQQLNLTAMLEGPFGWGAGCQAERANGRAGYCDFKVKHLLAVNAMGQVTLARASQIVTPLAAVLSERDGMTRNGLAAKALRSPLLLGNTAKVAACMFRQVGTCAEGSNACGAPHSIFSRTEQLPKGPMFWEQELLSQVSAHFLRGAAGSGPSQLGTLLTAAQELAPPKDLCARVPDLRNPDPRLFGAVPLSGVLTLAITGNPNNVSAIVQAMFKDATTDALYLKKLLEQVSVGAVEQAVTKGVALIRMSFPNAAAAAELEAKIRANGLLTGVGSGVKVVQFQQEGAEPVLAPRTSSAEDLRAALPESQSAGALAGVAVAVVAAVVLGVALVKSRSSARRQQQRAVELQQVGPHML
jgi:alpha-beta hydrolase superfamily lysophospholipase